MLCTAHSWQDILPPHSVKGASCAGTSTCLSIYMLSLQVAQLTYPMLLTRYETILTIYSQHIQQNTEGKDRLQLDETLCVLEVCSAMKIAPAVADAAPQAGNQQKVLESCVTSTVPCLPSHPLSPLPHSHSPTPLAFYCPSQAPIMALSRAGQVHLKLSTELDRIAYRCAFCPVAQFVIRVEASSHWAPSLSTCMFTPIFA